ncbi:restriction endonuclease subunit S [Salmonella enterica subsp. enterica serovar Albuquerque]|nr:restriction endonuclease subunit S [Salmonella enterica subsp. enterica serovar Albuquerque]
MSGGKLPEGWINTTIGDISVKCSQRVPDENEQFIYVDIGSINRELKVIENPQYLIGKDAPSRARKEIKARDIIVSLTRPNLNAVALVSEKYDEQIASTGFEVIRPTLVESRYIFALVRSRHFIDSISGLVQGALYPAAKSSDVQSYEFPLPPLAEQKIIAEKLDTLLAQVDSTKARLEQIPQILKRFRQAVLAAAVSGLLIGSNKRKHHPLCSEWQWPDLPSNWDVHKYSELVDSRLGKMLDKAKNIGSSTKYLGNINVRWFGFDLENLQNILISDIERRELSLKPGDVLICEGGEPGRCAIWCEPQDTPIIFQKALHRARVKEKIIPEWLVYNLKNDSNNNSLSQIFTGTTIKHLTGKALANYPIRVPPLEEQHEIVRRVEQLFAYADTIEKQVNSALTRVNSLTQSILAKAFRGELTAQWRAENPDLISGENSAAALLEKIKAERAASSGKKTSRKKA